MKKALLLIILLAIYASPALAAGNLTINGTSLAPTFINTRTVTNMLNLTLNSTNGDTNITAINVTINGSATIGNVSLVALINSTGSVIASSSSNVTATKFTVSISGGFNVSSQANTSLIVAVNLSSSATVRSNVSLQINGAAEIGVDTGSNITLADGFVNSTESQIQDVHANSSVIPRIVDTSVINQTFVYTFTPLGTDTIQNFSINLPSGYTLGNLTALQQGASNLSTSLYSNITRSNQLNITLNTPTTELVKIFFYANTSSSYNSGNFTSIIDGSNMTGVQTDPVNGNQTNVTTKQLLNVTSITASKTTAIVNGTDYWEFSISVNFTDTITGLLQFKMANWNNNEGAGSMSLTNGTEFYATLRKDAAFSTATKYNITNEYNLTSGLSYSSESQGLKTLYLRMVLPLGTPIASTWFTTYNMIFRSSA